MSESTKPMDFRFFEVDLRPIQMGLRQMIYADGLITSGAATRLERHLTDNRVNPAALLTFNSGGGDLFEALELGRLVRARRLDTSVGSAGDLQETGLPIPQPGRCLSACTFAYLGGAHRYVGRNSQFGVHMFSSADPEDPGSLDAGQVISAQIVEYVKEMGADPMLLSEMVRALDFDGNLNILTQERMTELRVTTPHYETKWEIIVDTGRFVMMGRTTDIRGRHAVKFACGKSADGQKHLLMFPFYEAGGYLEYMVRFCKDPQLILTEGHVPLLPEEVQTPIYPAANGYAASFVKVTPRVLNLLRTTDVLGFAWGLPNPDLYVGFTGDFSAARDKVFGFFDAC